MTCNRDKNSVKGKDVHWGIPLHAELWGGSLENDLQSWQELYAREGCAFRNTIACRAFRGGSLENDLQSWQELYEREGCALRNTIVCRALGGEAYKNDLQPWEELFAREGCALRTTIACRALGGGSLEVIFRKMTCNRDKNSVKGKDVHWGLPLHAELWGGGSLENDLQSWQELCEREGCALRNTIACRAFGGEV